MLLYSSITPEATGNETAVRLASKAHHVGSVGGVRVYDGGTVDEYSTLSCNSIKR